MSSVKGRPYPLGLEELRLPCQVVGGSNLAKHAVVRLVTGTNTTGATLDQVAASDWFGDQVCSLTLANYPSAADDGPVASQDRVCPFAIGILEAATNDDKIGYVTFRGLINDLVVTVVNAEVYAQGGLVFLDSSDSFNIKAESNSANILAIGDIVIGRLAQGFTASGTSNTSKVFINGLNLEPRSV